MSDLEVLTLASELGTIIGSEEACGLSYDQDAIAAFIEDRVDPEAMSFAPQLNVQVMGSEMMVSEMSESAKTAHCTAVRRSAEAYGLLGGS